VQLLPWDTEFFGVEIARATVARPDALASMIAAAQERDVQCMYVVVPEAEANAVGAAIRAGSVLTALRLELDHDGDAAAKWPRDVRMAGPDDSDRVLELSVALARFSRFAQDRRFPSDRIEEMYRTWALNDLQHGDVIVGNDGGGVVALSRRAQALAVDLVYVEDSARGAGLARALLDAVIATAGGDVVTVATDVRNVQAVRLYESAGFRARSLDAILHLWLDDLS
jgi:dTDP-4-amino-4,6-dideoxy-D-galactose acyltransferase